MHRFLCCGPLPAILCLLAAVAGHAGAVKAPCCEGFGRFGVAPTDGVLVGALSPGGDFARGATWGHPMASVNLAPPGDGEVTVDVHSVNWVTKQIVFTRGQARRQVTYSILSPGILVECAPPTFTLEGFGRAHTIGSEPQTAPAVTVLLRRGGQLRRHQCPTASASEIPVAEMDAPWLLLWDSISLQPVQVVFTSRPRSLRLEPTPAGLRLVAEGRRRTTFGIAYPLGRRSRHAAEEVLQPEDAGWLGDHCDRLTRLLMAFPMDCEERYEVRGDEAIVTNRISRYRTLPSDWDVEPLVAAPLPPMVSSGRRLGYPLTVHGDTTDLGIPTVWGPLEAILGRAEVAYRLPLPPLEETGYVDVVGQERLKDELNHCAGLEGYPEPGYNGWRLGTVSCNFPSKITGNALCAWAILTPEQQQALVRANERNMKAWGAADNPLAGWTYRREPHTGLRYPACFGQDSGIDMNWGNGLAVNGLQKYAHVFGEWEMVQRQFDFVHQALAYIEWSHDWAIMGDSAADDGSSGFGCDMATAAYAGVVSAARMARVLGREADFDRYAGLAAKLAVPLTVRLKFDAYAWEHELHCDRHFINGFQETQLFQHNAATNDPDPWWLTCSYNGYGVHQELFDLVMRTARPETAEWAALVPQYFPRILDGERAYRYPYPTSHDGNSGYITLHWFHARSLLGEDEETLLREMAHNRETSGSGFYWMAPIVYAELMNRHSPLVLSEWAPAAYVSGRYDPETQEADLVFRLPEGKTAAIEVAVRSLPAAVLVNDRPAAAAFDAASHKMARQRPVRLRPNYVTVPIEAGESHVRLLWESE